MRLSLLILDCDFFKENIAFYLLNQHFFLYRNKTNFFCLYTYKFRSFSEEKIKCKFPIHTIFWQSEESSKLLEEKYLQSVRLLKKNKTNLCGISYLKNK